MAIDFNFPRSYPMMTSQSEPGVQARDLVDARFLYLTDLAEDFIDKFNESVDQMEGILSPIVVDDISASGVEVPELGGDIPSFTDTFTKEFSAELADFEVSYVEPDGKPDSALAEWEEGTINLESEFIDKVAFWLTSGEPAIPVAILNDIYNAAELQLDEKRNEAILLEESKVASRNFEIPAGVADAKIMQIEREYGKSSAELSASLAGKNMELTQANFHKAVDVAQAYITAAKDYIVKRNEAKIQWYSAAIDAWVKQVDAAIKVIEAKVAAFNGQVEAYKAKATAYQTEAGVFESRVKAYTALVEGLKAKYETLAETIKMRVEVFKAESQAEIEEAKLKVQAQISQNSLAENILASKAGMYSQMTSSAFGGVHVQASMSSNHSTGQSVSFGYSYGESVSEQHSESQSVSIEG